MLSEPDSLALDAERCKEEEGTCDEVSNSLVTHDAIANSVTHSHHDWVSLVVVLSDGAPKWKFKISNSHELGMRFVLGVNEMLDLSHRELTDTK